MSSRRLPRDERSVRGRDLEYGSDESKGIVVAYEGPPPPASAAAAKPGRRERRRNSESSRRAASPRRKKRSSEPKARRRSAERSRRIRGKRHASGLQLGGAVDDEQDEDEDIRHRRQSSYEGIAYYDPIVKAVLDEYRPSDDHGLGLQMLLRIPGTRDLVFERDVRLAMQHKDEVMAGRRKPGRIKARERKYGYHLGRIKKVVMREVANEKNVEVDTIKLALQIDPERFAAGDEEDGFETSGEVTKRIHRLVRLREEVKSRIARRRWKAAISAVRDQVRAALAIKSFFDPYSDSGWGLRHWLHLYVQPSYTHYYRSHLPICTFVIVLAQIIVFAFYSIESDETPRPQEPTYGPDLFTLRLRDYSCVAVCGADASAPPTFVLSHDGNTRHEGWRFLSYALLHSGYLHLIGNVLVELLLLMPLEAVHGWHVCLLFLLSVAGGGFTMTFTNPHQSIVGSSGGLFGAIGMHYANLALNWREIKQELYKWARVFFLTAVSIAASFQLRSANAAENQTAHGVHVGGLVTGFLFALPLLRDIKSELLRKRNEFFMANGEPWKVHDMYGSTRNYIALATFCGVGFVLFGIFWNAAHENPTPIATWWGPYDPVDDWCSFAAQGFAPCA